MISLIILFLVRGFYFIYFFFFFVFYYFSFFFFFFFLLLLLFYINSKFIFLTFTYHYSQKIGNIPSQLGNLDSLSTLNLNNNHLSGLVPQFFVDESNHLTTVDLSNNLFVCPIPPGAEYTKATCNDWFLSYTPTKCFNNPYDTTDIFVFGQGFQPAMEGVNCVFQMPGGAPTKTTKAFVASSTMIVCPRPFLNFTGCDGSSGRRLVEHGNLSLGLEGTPSPISNSIQFNAFNPHCPYGYYLPNSIAIAANNPIRTTHSSTHYVNVAFPARGEALLACEAGNTHPFRCPSERYWDGSSPNYVSPVFDVDCRDEGSCMWTMLFYMDKMLCPFHSTGAMCTTYFGDSDPTGSYSTSPCFDFEVEIQQSSRPSRSKIPLSSK